ncbi:MAG: hypothetical protein EA400_10520 [Chromatiaceae bacterium]|nr:MAG: hypothetical protein EA400_10520 [Chromatiaceae bacterium]
MHTEFSPQAITTLLLRGFESERLPCALNIRAQVLAGEPLAADDAAFLDAMVHDLDRAAALIGADPAIDRLRACALHLHDEILTQAQHQIGRA